MPSRLALALASLFVCALFGACDGGDLAAGTDTSADSGDGSGCGAPQTVGDGHCDPRNNTEACGYDGGDCCAQTCVSDGDALDCTWYFDRRSDECNEFEYIWQCEAWSDGTGECKDPEVLDAEPFDVDGLLLSEVGLSLGADGAGWVEANGTHFVAHHMSFNSERTVRLWFTTTLDSLEDLPVEAEPEDDYDRAYQTPVNQRFLSLPANSGQVSMRLDVGDFSEVVCNEWDGGGRSCWDGSTPPIIEATLLAEGGDIIWTTPGRDPRHGSDFEYPGPDYVPEYEPEWGENWAKGYFPEASRLELGEIKWAYEVAGGDLGAQAAALLTVPFSSIEHGRWVYYED